MLPGYFLSKPPQSRQESAENDFSRGLLWLLGAHPQGGKDIVAGIARISDQQFIVRV